MLELLTQLASPIRWLHVLSAAAWFGEVAVINFVLIPALKKNENPAADFVYRHIFPRIFRLATILSVTVVLSGTALLHVRVVGDWTQLFASGLWGVVILIGGGLAWAITIFHLFIEHGIARRAGFGPDTSETGMAQMHVVHSIIPRIAMLVLGIIFLLMMIAARGI